ncbi:porin [Janthinobacterium sp. HLX7-2]|uniref:porin n=1 Tax=Janthinobacterium sp. HLX7-2 TaxID=1259331 RepID=UPI003F2607F0
MKSFKQSHPKLTPLAIGVLALAVSMPAFAETEIETLRRELAEQKQLIQKILAAQETQKTQDVQTGGPNRGAGLQAGVPAGPVTPALTIYGVADIDVSRADSGFGNKMNIGSGGYTASRLGIKGEKDLGNDIKAVYLMEAGLSMNTGTVGTGVPTLGINNTVASNGALTSAGTQFFSRQIYAGLMTPAGTITAGRQYAGSYLASVSDSTAMGAGLYGSSATLLPVIASMPTRLNNSLVYISPKMRGVTAQLTLTTGSGNNVNTVVGTATSSTTDSAGRGGDLALFYANGPFKAAVTAWNVRNASFNPSLGETGLASRKGFQAGANYQFGIARIYATYVQGKIAGGGYERGSKILSKASGWSVSAGVPMGGGTALASYTRANDKSLIADRDVSLVGLAYTYKLFETTTLYGSWGKMINQRNASYSLSNGGDLVGTVSPVGFNPSGLMIGLNQVF